MEETTQAYRYHKAYIYGGKGKIISVVIGETGILLIEGKRADFPSFYAGLTRKGYSVFVKPSGNSALDYLKEKKPQVVIINTPSMRTSGKRICRAIHEFNSHLPIIMIVEPGSNEPEKLDADIVLILPFTLQKLLNRVRLLVPTEDTNLLIAGPIKMDIENRWVRCQSHHSSLTPRLMALLKALMDRPGEVFDREDLFRQVWETEYTGDTRTMDVHISWLRQAIEDDPRHPQLIKTVRGIGYRLDVDTHLVSEKTQPAKKN